MFKVVQGVEGPEEDRERPRSASAVRCDSQGPQAMDNSVQTSEHCWESIIESLAERVTG